MVTSNFTLKTPFWPIFCIRLGPPSYLDDFEEGFPVRLIHQSVVEDPVDLVHPETCQLLRAVYPIRATFSLQQQHALKDKHIPETQFPFKNKDVHVLSLILNPILGEEEQFSDNGRKQIQFRRK